MRLRPSFWDWTRAETRPILRAHRSPYMLRPLALVVALSGLAPATFGQGVYAVFEVEGGAARLVEATAVDDASARPAGGAGPERAAVRVLDGARVTFEAEASGGAVRGEFHGAPRPEGGFEIEAHSAPAERWAFAVRLPSGRLPATGTVEVTVTDGAARSAAPPLRTPVSDLAARARSTRRRASTARRLFGDGDAGNRIDLLVVGDGYTAAQEERFFADAARVARAFLDVTPYREYTPAFRASALFVASAEAGADQPATGSCVGNGRTVDTAFDATYCTSGIDRLLTVNTSKVYQAAAAVPEWDLALVIVNDTKYGGAGGGVSVISMHGAAVDLARHEVAHTFGGLADEYTEGTARTCVEPGCPPNVTPVTDRDALKWVPWVDAATPLPTPDLSAFDAAVGAFEGAFYNPAGMYRPHRNCLMRSLGVAFCPVCREHLVHRVYGGGWSRNGHEGPAAGVDGIEPGSERPALGGTLVADGPTTFSADLLDPDGGPPLDVEWRVDDLVASAERTFTFEPPEVGTYTVTLVASDPTPLVHPDRDRAVLSSTRTWTVEATVAVDAAGRPGATWGLVSVSPNPTRAGARVRYVLDRAGEARVEVLDGLGRRLAVLADGPHAAGAHEVSFGAGGLAPGVYLVRLASGRGADTRRLSVVR